MSIFVKFEEECKEIGADLQIVHNKTKTYAILSMNIETFADAAIYQFQSNKVVQKYFPASSYITSSKDMNTLRQSTTYCIGDIIDILKS
jgi:4-alpha-glucanotransferase